MRGQYYLSVVFLTLMMTISSKHSTILMSVKIFWTRYKTSIMMKLTVSIWVQPKPRYQCQSSSQLFRNVQWWSSAKKKYICSICIASVNCSGHWPIRRSHQCVKPLFSFISIRKNSPQKHSSDIPTSEVLAVWKEFAHRPRPYTECPLYMYIRVHTRVWLNICLVCFNKSVIFFEE